MSLAAAYWNCLGRVLQALPEFPTKGRWEWIWFPHRDVTRTERRRLPGGALIDCHLADYNETWIWMRLGDAKELKILKALLKPGQVFWDIGAHVGVWSLEAAAAIGKTGSVTSLEPNPATFKKLEHNLRLNPDLTQWKPRQLAASDRAGTAALWIDQMSECCALTQGSEGTVSVATSSVDELLEGGACHAMKIDVEGHELAVIEGAAQTLNRHRPWLCVEFNNGIHKLRNISEWPVHRRLVEMGYIAWRFSDADQRAGLPKLAEDFTTDGFVNIYYERL